MRKVPPANPGGDRTGAAPLSGDPRRAWGTWQRRQGAGSAGTFNPDASGTPVNDVRIRRSHDPRGTACGVETTGPLGRGSRYANRKAVIVVDSGPAENDTQVPAVTLGQFQIPSAWRKSLTGKLEAPVPRFWSVKRV
jgi:hypothetical protein